MSGNNDSLEDKLVGMRNSIIKALREEPLHTKPSPETDKRLTVMETNFGYINEDLKEIKKEISSSKIWLITTLISMLVASFSLAFWIGTWKGKVDQRLNAIESYMVREVSED